MSYHFRPIQPSDNAVLAQLIRQIVVEHGCAESNYMEDTTELEDIASGFQSEDSRYWVVVSNNTQQVVGGGGFARLPGGMVNDNICELQKLYFLPEARGQGLAKRMMDMILETAITLGYEEMYLECVPKLTQAIKLYESYQFQHLDVRKGNTGHDCCTIYMSRPL